VLFRSPAHIFLDTLVIIPVLLRPSLLLLLLLAPDLC